MAAHFIVYAARSSVRHFFEVLSDPSFFANINKILDDKYHASYKDPRGRVFAFENLKDFLTSSNGLGVDDWVAFMKALKAQDEGTEAKALFWRMVGIDPGLDPLVGQMLALESPLAAAQQAAHAWQSAWKMLASFGIELEDISRRHNCPEIFQLGIKQLGPGVGEIKEMMRAFNYTQDPKFAKIVANKVSPAQICGAVDSYLASQQSIDLSGAINSQKNF